MNRPSPPRRRRLAVALAVLTTLAVPPLSAGAVPPETPVVIDGGGWGHGIGMPQWAAHGQAQQGWRWRDIIRYWYEGAGIANASAITGVPDVIRVGTDRVKVGGVNQYRPFLWLDFEAIGGTVRICLDGETGEGCSFAAEPDVGETWRMAYEGGDCVLRRNSVVRHDGACGIHLEWDDQPTTRVAFPELMMPAWGLGEFARGQIWFEAPKQAVWNGTTYTGFHIVLHLTIDEYMYGLAEVPASWPQQALRAQAVAGRTYAAWKARAGINPDCSCHLFFDTRHQAYRGWHTLNEGNPDYGDRWRTAVDRTAGKVVEYPDASNVIAETYYFSSSGGATENVWDVWGPDTPAYRTKYAYLATQADEWSELAADYGWGVRWTKETTAGSIATTLGFDELVGMSIEGLRESGSPDRITVTGTERGLLTFDSYTGNQLQSRLGLISHYIHSIEGLEPTAAAGAVSRADAAAAVSAAVFPEGAGTVFLTAGRKHPHAFTLSPAASHVDAPTLIVENGGVLPDATQAELLRLAPDQVVVVADVDDVPESTLDAIRSLLPAATVGRIAGSNRYTTAAALSAAVFAPGPDVVYVTSGRPMHALLASHAAALDGNPVLLVRNDGIPAAVEAELTRLAPEKIVVIGTSDEVSEAVYETLSGLASAIERVDEDGKYPLSIALSALTHPDGSPTVYLSIGRSHPWSLNGSMAFAADPGPVLVVKRGVVPIGVVAEIARLAPSRIVLLSAPHIAQPDLIDAVAGLVGP